MPRFCGLISSSKQLLAKIVFLLIIFFLSLSTEAFSQTVIRDEYWGGNSGKHRKDFLGQASDITEMEVVADDNNITVTIRGPFFYNYIHHIKGADKTPPGDLYISSTGWKVKGSAPYADDTFTKDEGWDYVVSLFDKAVYKLEWSKIQWTRPKPGSVIYRRDQAWRGGYGDFVSWAQIKLTDKSLVISFPIDALLQEIIPSGDVPEGDTAFGSNGDPTGDGTGEDGFGSASMLDIGLHWTMMCGNDIIEGVFSLPATIYSDYEEAEEIPLPRPTTWGPPPPIPLVPWHNNPKEGTILPLWWDDHDHHHHHDVPEPSTILLLLPGLCGVPFLLRRSRKKK